MKYKKRGRRVKKVSKLKKFITRFKKLSKKKKILFIAVWTFFLVLIAGAIAVFAYINSKLNQIDTQVIEENEIVVNEAVEENVGTGYTNFVLFGSDSRTDDVSKNLNTDTIIIASLNNATKEVKLVSVFRDTLLDIKDGNIQKCNSAYARGGAAQAMSMLNKNLDMNIKKYVTVSFSVVADIVDMLGGIEVYVTPEEAAAVNGYIVETARVCGKEAVFLKWGGHQVLDGVQATTYARIRKGVGDDFGRAERQRLVIEKIFEKMLQSDLATINKIIDAVLPQVSTNLTNAEIMSYAAGVFGYSITGSDGFPFDRGTATLNKRGSCVYATTLESNVSQLHEFLFGAVDYQPSATVKNISNEVAYLVSTSKTTGTTSNDDEEDGDVVETPETDTEAENDENTGTTTPGTGEGTGTTTPGTGEGSGTTTPGTGEGSGTTTPGTGEGSGTTTPGTGEGSGTTTPGTGEGSGTTTPETGGGSGSTDPGTGGGSGSTTPDSESSGSGSDTGTGSGSGSGDSAVSDGGTAE